jgi:hypothetical protein
MKNCYSAALALVIVSLITHSKDVQAAELQPNHSKLCLAGQRKDPSAKKDFQVPFNGFSRESASLAAITTSQISIAMRKAFREVIRSLGIRIMWVRLLEAQILAC